MHRFLRSVGFSEIRKTEDLDRILRDVAANHNVKTVAGTPDGRQFVELSLDYAYDCGITLCGEYDDSGRFRMEYYYPHYRGSLISSNDEVIIDRQADKRAFVGACEDRRVDITLIFTLIQAAQFLNSRQDKDSMRVKNPALALSCLAETGTVLLPVKKNVLQMQEATKKMQKRNALITRARNGDEDAIESLTIDDMDTFNRINRRIMSEDLYSIVDTCFMPYGFECDQYSIVGEIRQVRTTTNSYTGEMLYQMAVVCNDISLDVCINAADLFGEPKRGRRFKGVVWLMGSLYY